jgi:putative glutathione S-transferase
MGTGRPAIPRGRPAHLADVRIFPTLIRFDQAYHTGFKCDRKFLHQYEDLWPYLRDLYTTPGFAETVRMDHIEQGYYRSRGELNRHDVIPTGPDLDYSAPHDRDRLPGGPPAALTTRAADRTLRSHRSVDGASRAGGQARATYPVSYL